MKRTMLLILLFTVTVFMVSAETKSQPAQPDSKIGYLINERVDKHHQDFGIVVGIVSEQGHKIISYGKQSRRGKPVDGNTLFELCSVTKVFTSLLLADMVKRGEVNLDDPIEKYLPKSVKVPAGNGKKITLLHLATHTSGLPNTPENKSDNDGTLGYEHFTKQKLYDFLSTCTLTREPGDRFHYSNLGAALLGHALSLIAGKPYDQLVLERICQPLGMKSTRRELTRSLSKRLAVGYFLDGQQATSTDMPAVLGGAGGLRSSAKDILIFLEANMGLHKSRLFNAMQDTHTGRFNISKNIVKIGLAWTVVQKEDVHILIHEGARDGYRAFIGFNPRKKIGVVVFANFQDIITDIGIYALTGQREILKLSESQEANEVKVDPEIYNDYAGKYQVTPSFFIHVTKEGDRLFAQGTGQPKFELFPEAETTFFLKAVRAKIIFERDSSGKFTRLIVRSSTGDEIGKKID